jgi:hypothetical protein
MVLEKNSNKGRKHYEEVYQLLKKNPRAKSCRMTMEGNA